MIASMAIEEEKAQRKKTRSPEGGEDKNSVNYGVSLKVFDLENLHKRGCIFSSIQCMEFSLI